MPTRLFKTIYGVTGSFDYLKNSNSSTITVQDSITFQSAITASNLPTTEPTTTGSMWISGSSVAHPNSGYLMIFNP